MNDATSAALLRYLCERFPDDDAARLVYADHLEDQGRHERAELIRVQVGLTRGYDPTAAARETELLTLHGDNWREEVPAWARPGSNFHRGFVAEVRCTVVDWVAGGADLVARTPIEEVFFEPGPTDAATLAASPALSRVPDADPVPCRPSAQRARSRSSPGLSISPISEELFLAGNDLGNEAVHWLAGARSLAKLTELDLRDNRISDAGAGLLAAASHFRQLTTLYLVNNRIGDEASGSGWPTVPGRT